MDSNDPEPSHPIVPAEAQLPAEQPRSLSHSSHPESALAPGEAMLPSGLSLQRKQAQEVALREGFSPTAIDLAERDGQWTIGQRLRTMVLTIPFVAAVVWFFPSERFFKAPLKPMEEVALAGSLTDAQVAEAELVDRPMMETRRDMEALAAEGDLPGAIRLAQQSLAKVLPAERGLWREVYYRNWEYLEKSVRNAELEASIRSFREVDTSDPVFAWYYARIVNRKAAQGHLTTAIESKQTFAWLEAASNRLTYQLAGDKTEQPERVLLTHRMDLIRLEEARLHHNLWKLYGYPEKSDHPGLAHRDSAIRLCREMGSELEAQRLLLNIYERVLDQWWFFERTEILGDEAMQKSSLRERRDALRTAIEKALTEERSLEP